MLILYSASHCSLCAHAEYLADSAEGVLGRIARVDILDYDGDDIDALAMRVPFVAYKDRRLYYPFSIVELVAFANG